MELARFAQLGAEIAEKSLALKERREEAAVILKEIKALEDEIRPLVMEHTKFVAEMIGAAIPPTLAAPAPVHMPVPGPHPGPHPMPVASAYASSVNPFATPLNAAPMQLQESSPMKARVRAYLKKMKTNDDSEEGLSASTIAEQLGVDAGVVREVIRENMSGGR